MPPAPRGVPQIEVSFEIDANGILKVSARDKGTGSEQSIEISNTGSLSAREVEKMRMEAEVYAEKDRRRKQLVELKNQVDSLFYSYQSTLKNQEKYVSSELKAQVKQKVTEIRAAFANPVIRVEEVKGKIDALQQLLFEIGTYVYEQGDSTQPEMVPSAAGSKLSTLKVEEDTASFSDEEDDSETVTADYEAIE